MCILEMKIEFGASSKSSMIQEIIILQGNLISQLVTTTENLRDLISMKHLLETISKHHSNPPSKAQPMEFQE